MAYIATLGSGTILNIAAMNNGIHVGTEVPAALTVKNVKIGQCQKRPTNLYDHGECMLSS